MKPIKLKEESTTPVLDWIVANRITRPIFEVVGIAFVLVVWAILVSLPFFVVLGFALMLRGVIS